jgi:hypothetical protein
MLFAQLTNRDSLRDIEICLRGMEGKLYRIGIRGKISRSTLSDANNQRPSAIYRDFCKILSTRAQELYKSEEYISESLPPAYALDSSWVKVCLELCPWALFSKSQNTAFIKLHTLLDLRGAIPTFIAITPANINDFLLIDDIPFLPGSFVVMDKGYFDLSRLGRLNDRHVYFVIRKKKYVTTRCISENIVDSSATGIISDKIVRFKGRHAIKNYPDRLRQIKFEDLESSRKFIYLTNNFNLSADIICYLYKERWNIEIFFRWIKQHLRVTKFYGTSANAIETQIFISTAAYLLVAIAKKELKLKQPLYQILHLFSVSLFEEIPIIQALSGLNSDKIITSADNQLILL